MNLIDTLTNILSEIQNQIKRNKNQNFICSEFPLGMLKWEENKNSIFVCNWCFSRLQTYGALTTLASMHKVPVFMNKLCKTLLQKNALKISWALEFYQIWQQHVSKKINLLKALELCCIENLWAIWKHQLIQTRIISFS